MEWSAGNILIGDHKLCDESEPLLPLQRRKQYSYISKNGNGEEGNEFGNDETKEELNVSRSVHRKSAGRWKQYFATFTVCFGSFGSGFTNGWASPMLMILKSPESPVGPMTLTQMSYLETLPLISGLVSIYLYGGTIDKYGRKITGYLSVIPALIGSTLLIVASEPMHLYVGRALTGMWGVGSLVAGPIFLSEVAHESRRGSLLSFIMFIATLGTLVSYILGDLLDYVLYNLVGLASPILFLTCFYWFPESPYFLASKSNFDYAKESLRWYRGGNDELVNEELSIICNLHNKETSFQELLKSRCFRRALLLVVFMFLFTHLGGSSIIGGYASVIFQDGGGSLSPNKATIILFTVKVVATILSSLLVDHTGRRPLMIGSFLCMGIALMILSVYFVLKDDGLISPCYTWIPLASLCTYNLALAMGVGTLSEVISNEIVSPNIKGTVSIVSGTITLSAMAICLQAYPFIHSHIGTYGNFVYSSFFNFVGCAIAYMVLPETKGKSLAEILLHLNEDVFIVKK